jgi:hypothetical protein
MHAEVQVRDLIPSVTGRELTASALEAIDKAVVHLETASKRLAKGEIRTTTANAVLKTTNLPALNAVLGAKMLRWALDNGLANKLSTTPEADLIRLEQASRSYEAIRKHLRREIRRNSRLKS